MSRGIAILISALLGALSACRAQRTPSASAVIAPMPQAAYVWQRNWTPGVREAVAQPPAGIDSLRVLLAEVSASPANSDIVSPPSTTTPSMTRPSLTMMNLDAQSLAASRLPITLVVRIEGSRPIDDLEMSSFVRAGDTLRAAGVTVVGIEVDHDCATARLADYAGWLERQRGVLSSASSSSSSNPSSSNPSSSNPSSSNPSSSNPSSSNPSSSDAPYRFSITALPTWASSPSLVDVARNVDEIVVQVHAVRAPMIFDANDAWRDLSRFARALRPVELPARTVQPATIARTPRMPLARTVALSVHTVEPAVSPILRVALPTYTAVVRDVEVSVDPDDVARFAGKLRATNDPDLARVRGIVWFRLPVDGDTQTWSRATFARIVADVGAKGFTNSRPTEPTRARLHVGTTVSSEATVARATIELVSQGAQRFDVVVTNRTDELVDLPRVRVVGDIDDADMVAGYRAVGPGTWDAPRRSLGRAERIVIGWIHGKDITLVH